MAQTDLVVVGVVGGSDLHRASSEALLDILVRNQGDLAVSKGQQKHLADLTGVTFVRGVDRDRGVAHDGLGTSGGDNHAAGSIRVGIFDVPEVATLLAVDDLLVRERGAGFRTPVDDAVSFVD